MFLPLENLRCGEGGGLGRIGRGRGKGPLGKFGGSFGLHKKAGHDGRKPKRARLPIPWTVVS